MRSLLPLILYCISLVSLQQLLTLAHEESPDENRLDLLNELFALGGDKPLDSGSRSEAAFPSSASGEPLKRVTAHLRRPPAPAGLAWARPPRPSQIEEKPQRVSRHGRRTRPSLAWARPAEGARIRRRSLRVRRRAPVRGGHYSHNPQLMRVGCVLGTCQVQNLSHRLYQLIGQNGKEDSSPINPRSPHSYG